MADKELIQEFVAESMDLLDDVEPKLIELLEANDLTGSVNPDLINTIFRLFHSMKGGAGMLALDRVAALTHTAETLLDLFRKGEASLTHNHVALLFKALDLVRRMLTQVAETYSDEGFEGDSKLIIAELETAIGKKDTPSPAAPAEAAAEAEPAAEDAFMEIPITPEMKERFVQEADDLLESFEQGLMTLEKTASLEAANQAFRAIHSFKGNCGFMGLSDLNKLAHKMENVLEAIKNGSIAPTAEITGILLSWIDSLRDAIAGYHKGGTGEIANLGAYVDFLTDMLQEWLAKGNGSAAPAGPEAAAAAPAVHTEQTPAPEQQKEKEQAAPPPSPAPGSARQIQRQDIRVDLRKLDALINLVGELVIAEAMITQHPLIAQHEDEGVERAVHQLRRVSRDLQDVAMSVRMIPLSATFQKMVRLVHDLSNKSGKRVNLELRGEETEVDKTVIESIGDPLVHIVRNALDHGLEPPAERSANGKPETGSLIIEGKHEGSEVWICISDDGRGLHRDRILKKATERGLVQGDGRELSDQQVFKLIFEPGFSTAETITDISGRGVGMDVVKKNIEKLKGRIDVHSTPGEGATFVLRIPLTLAIIDGMLVRVGNARYTIPLLNIRESIRAAADRITITPDGQEIVRVRDELIPVVRLHQVFDRQPDAASLEEGILVIVEADGQTMCLFVDELLGQQETVIKALSSYFGSARNISGCTILGDGEVSLILDVRALMSAASRAVPASYAAII